MKEDHRDNVLLSSWTSWMSILDSLVSDKPTSHFKRVLLEVPLSRCVLVVHPRGLCCTYFMMSYQIMILYIVFGLWFIVKHSAAVQPVALYPVEFQCQVWRPTNGVKLVSCGNTTRM